VSWDMQTPELYRATSNDVISQVSNPDDRVGLKDIMRTNPFEDEAVSRCRKACRESVLSLRCAHTVLLRLLSRKLTFGVH